MQTQEITLKNDFHNSEVKLRAKIETRADGSILRTLTDGQIRRARNHLCGASECQCSGEMGTRGRQDGVEIIVHPRSWSGPRWAEVMLHSDF